MKFLCPIYDKNGDEILGGGSTGTLITGSLTIGTTGWVAGSGDWAYKLQVAITGITSDMVVLVFPEKDDIDVATIAEIGAIDSYDGGLWIYAAKKPTEEISAKYVVLSTSS